MSERIVSSLVRGAADRLRAKVEATPNPVLKVHPVDYWAAIAEGLPDAEWNDERQMTIGGVVVEIDYAQADA